MKVLWFTNIPMPAVKKQWGSSNQTTGHWMNTLLERVSTANNTKLAIATAVPGQDDCQFTDNGVEYFVIGQSKRFSKYQVDKDLKKCADIVNSWNPDLVHIHGTERFYGLLNAKRLIETPTIISIQGLLRSINKKYFGSLSWKDVLRAHQFKELCRGIGLFLTYMRYKDAAKYEKQIIASTTAFTGQTEWDRAQVWSINPNATYYRVGRVLRNAFSSLTWDLNNCRRHQIIFTNARGPLRGVETLLEAVKILRVKIPDIKLCLAGGFGDQSGYGRFQNRRVQKLGISDCVEAMGYIDADTMAKALCSSHVFAIASHIENESLSLCEAMRVGMPCVASYAGGIPSMIDDEETGLLFPPGDAAGLAHRVHTIFQDDGRAVRLGAAARKKAIERHDPDRVVNDLFSAYRDAVSR